jgi:hypothetical protein
VFEHVKEGSTYVMNFADGSCRLHCNHQPGGRQRPHEISVPELVDKNTWYIVDPGDVDCREGTIIPVLCRAFSLTLSSPDKRHFGALTLGNGHYPIEYLTVPSEAEVVAMSKYMWPEEIYKMNALQRATMISERGAIIGFLPNWIFSHHRKFIHYRSGIEVAIAEIDIDKFLEVLLNNGNLDKDKGMIRYNLTLANHFFYDHQTRHLLLHLHEVISNDYVKTGTPQLLMKFASPWVLQQVQLKMIKAKDETILRVADSYAPGLEELKDTALKVVTERWKF